MISDDKIEAVRGRLASDPRRAEPEVHSPHDHRGSIASTKARREYQDAVDLLTALDEARAATVCDSCAGRGEAMDGGPCGCGGSGRLSDMATYLREMLFEAEARDEDEATRRRKAEAGLNQATFELDRAKLDRDKAETERDATLEMTRGADTYTLHPAWASKSHAELLEALRFQGAMTSAALRMQDRFAADGVRLRLAMEAAVSDLGEHVADGCAGPVGNARSYACRECALSGRLARALIPTETASGEGEDTGPA